MPEAAAFSSRERSFNHLAWIAPVIAIAGFLSYFAVFSQWPLFRDFPWLNLLILLAALALSLVAARRAKPGWGRAGSIAGLGLSALLLAGLSFYCFVLSYQLPDAGRVVGEGAAIPAITLAATDGSQVDVGAAAQDKLILVCDPSAP